MAVAGGEWLVWQERTAQPFAEALRAPEAEEERCLEWVVPPAHRV